MYKYVYIADFGSGSDIDDKIFAIDPKWELVFDPDIADVIIFSRDYETRMIHFINQFKEQGHTVLFYDEFIKYISTRAILLNSFDK